MRQPSRFLICFVALLCLALGGLSIVYRGEGVTVLVLRDISDSVPTIEADRIVARLAKNSGAEAR